MWWTPGKRIGLDFLRRFFRKGGGQIGASNLLLAHQRSDQASNATEQIGGLDRIEIARDAQHSDGQGADCEFDRRFDRIAKTGFRAKEQRMH